jgi:hypothetical protein
MYERRPQVFLVSLLPDLSKHTSSLQSSKDNAVVRTSNYFDNTMHDDVHLGSNFTLDKL